ncbi:MAG: response regulator [Desulfobacteraceae bacterium]|nr:response regulator [Desulfobacteraceae bacterium]
MNDKGRTILCVDDETFILHSLKRLLRREGYKILTASSGMEAIDILKQNKVHLIISDQRMPEMNGTEFFAHVKEEFPDVLRIILTGYTDVDSITESINKGHIYKFFLKPWNDHNLKLEIRQALDQYDLVQANKRLDEQVVVQNDQLKQMNEHLEELVEERTREIAIQNHALQLSHAVLEDLPLPIIGADNNTMIILVNKMAKRLISKENINIGVPLSMYFGEKIDKAVENVIKSGQSIQLDIELKETSAVTIDMYPFSGHYKGKGVIITLGNAQDIAIHK